ncbi:LysR family transcriptional regulator [Undibacterium sp. TJN19]|uniref:LysR family transcriptional regulator n=1 Tax=Undibacterium sp. TJN19 TaxID=3413055 RepID=UPI003BF485C5
MNRNVDLALLRTLLHVSETGSMNGAAQRLHVTQGAVSQQIKRLELMLDQRLLDRNSGGARLTESGQRLAGKARELLKMHDELFASFTAPQVRGTVRLGVPHDLMATHLPPILHEFAPRYPLVDIALTGGSSIELRKIYEIGELDLVILEEIHSGSGGHLLALELPAWVGALNGNAWARRPLPISLVSANCVFRQLIQSTLGFADVEWCTLIDFPSAEATSATVNADEAVSVLLPSTVPRYLQILGPESGLPTLPLFAITLHSPALLDNPAAAALKRAIVDAYSRQKQVSAA